jgi:hypothetical protein
MGSGQDFRRIANPVICLQKRAIAFLQGSDEAAIQIKKSVESKGQSPATDSTADRDS